MKLHKNSGFWLCLAINMLFNLEWTVPAWILLALHFMLGISLWWFVAALGLWATILSLITLFLCLISSCGSSADKPKKNKNPYSASRFSSEDEPNH